MQKLIKDKYPNLIAGGILGTLIGPFGLVGNLAVGSALGLASSTEGFHTFLFGDPNDPNNNGLAGKIHDKIINNLDDIFHNMGNAISGGIRRLGKRISRRISKYTISHLYSFVKRYLEFFLNNICLSWKYMPFIVPAQ